jgi:molybdate transport system permease protein
MILDSADIGALWLTFKVASLTTFILMLIGTPLAWWLSQTPSRWKTICNALVALPLVLPPSVLGFYLLLLMGKNGVIGQFTASLNLGTLPFTFTGLVIASVLYSLPFVVQPLQTAFLAIEKEVLEAAATLGATSMRIFFSIVIPLSRSGFISAAILGFAHTVGEFGVVLMVGGNIPDKTRVVSVQIYNHVEALEYQQAHELAAILLLFSFSVLVIAYGSLKQNLFSSR